MKVKNQMVINFRGGCPYRRVEDLATAYQVSKKTVKDRAADIEKLIGERYPDTVILKDGNLKWIDERAWLDFTANRTLLKDSTARRYAEPYDPVKWARALGWEAVYVRTA